MTIKELREKRNKTWEAAKAFLETHRTDKGVLSAEDDVTYARMEKEIEDYLNQAESKIMLCIDIAYPKVEAIIKNTNIEQLVVVSATRSMDLIVRAVYKITKGRKNHIKKSQHVLTWGKFLSKANKYIGSKA